MHVSEARVRANQANASRSTGSTSEAGKMASRRNSYRHGLTGRGVVLAEEDAAEIERRVDALEEDMKPTTPGGQFMIRRMAEASVRIERAAAHETAAIARRVRHAADDFDEGRIDQAEQLFKTLADDPRRVLRKLKKSPEGIDCLLDAWQDLRELLAGDPDPAWTPAHLERAAMLCGVRAEAARGTRFEALSRALQGDFGSLAAADGGHLAPETRRRWAQGQLVERIDLEVASLEAHRETLDLSLIEMDRAEAGSRALFDPGQDATLARRYEAAAQRRYDKSLQEYRRTEAESADRREREDGEPPSPRPWDAPEPRMGSFGERPASPPRDPAPTPVEVDHADVSWLLGRDGQPWSLGQPPRPPG